MQAGIWEQHGNTRKVVVYFFSLFFCTYFNPTALRKTKTANNFGLSECNRVMVKVQISLTEMDLTLGMTHNLQKGVQPVYDKHPMKG